MHYNMGPISVIKMLCLYMFGLIILNNSSGIFSRDSDPTQPLELP